MPSSISNIKSKLTELRKRILSLMEKEVLLEADLEIAKLRTKNYSKRWRVKKDEVEG